MTTKADSKFKIVGAASVAAKVTRDACVEGWYFPESEGAAGQTFAAALGSGYPSGMSSYYAAFGYLAGALTLPDPNTQAWLKSAVEPVFGFPNIVRFSWTTVKVLLEKHAHAVKWSVRLAGLCVAVKDNNCFAPRTDEGQASLIKAFEGAKGLDKDRCAVTKDLHIKSVNIF